MPFYDRYMYILVVYRTGGCIKIRPAKVIKMAVIQDGAKMLINIELSDKNTLSLSNIDVLVYALKIKAF